MKLFRCLIIPAVALLCAVSCVREEPSEEDFCIPEGEPVTMYIGFGAGTSVDLHVATKGESSRVDENYVHDLYVFIFKEDGSRLYGRYFTYEHLYPTITEFQNQKNEGWYVDNISVSNAIDDKDKTADQKKKTRGAVKISTESCNNCTLVLLANISNTVANLNGNNALEELTSIETLSQLKSVKVTLEQNVVNRSNLFLMLGKSEENSIKTGDLLWGTLSGSTPNYNTGKSQIELVRLDAKVKFRIKYNTDNISAITPRNWEVHRAPENCYLYPDETVTRDQHDYFDAQPAYFDGQETDSDGTYDVFTFYMLENRQTAKKSVNEYNGTLFGAKKSKYFLRELQIKDSDTEHGDPYVVNRDPLEDGWEYARQDATFVKFDLVLTLTPIGIAHMHQGIAEALTTEARYTVHLGNFTSSSGGDFDDYNTYRGHNYTYDITVNNAESIYIEVRGEGGDEQYKSENEPGHEGSLLLTTDGIINCDAHYEYHSMNFTYRPELGKNGVSDVWENRKKYSWHIKTPFFDGGAAPGVNFDEESGFYRVPEGADYQWVKFRLNKMQNGKYVTERNIYPGYDPNVDAVKDNYIPDWYPGKSGYAADFVPPLMDINQLINFIFVQNEKRYRGEKNLFDKDDMLRITAFVDEYYYERHPVTGEFDPNLWRDFINAKPRELHILSDTEHSDDRRSDVILSSHSIVQQSIQTIYNIFAPDLTSLWGAEHLDEMGWVNRERYRTGQPGWKWYQGERLPGAVLYGDEENGRLNSAGIWALTSGTSQRWDTFLNNEVANNTPELRSDKFYQAFSCLTRNRDNNGNGIIDQDEVRWYTASINQLVGMWVGKEALSLSARLYQPIDGTSITDPVLWRSETISSTCLPGSDNKEKEGINDPRILRSEEAATKSYYSVLFSGLTATTRDKVASVRCLRNVGSFSDNGTIRDISEAPFDKMIDQYYDFEEGQDPNGKAWPNEDGTYTIRFTRLNPKALREFTDEELPYHNENSLNNRVYLRFTAQNPTDLVKEDYSINMSKGQQGLNEKISQHNDYCPQGYRLPNMTELLMMSALLPRTYWLADAATEASKTATQRDNKSFPCRTFFSRGILGGDLQTNTEKNKIGWGYKSYEDRIKLQTNSEGNTIMSVRCIRDDNMVGDITGAITVTDNENRRLTQDWEIDLNFFSLSSVIRYVQLKLCYVDVSGNKREMDLPSGDVQLGGTTIRQWLTIPKEALEGRVPVYGFVTVRAEVRNAAGITRYFDTPVRLVPELYTSIKLLPYEYDAAEYTNGEPLRFPLLITASHMDTEVTSLVLRATGPDKRTATIDISDRLPAGNPTYASIIYGYNPGTLKTGTYSFQLEAVCDGLITRSEEVSMNILKANYDPLTGVDVASVTEATQIEDYVWKREMIQGLDFAAGDFIEADMDVSRCVFVPVSKDPADPFDPADPDFTKLDQNLSVGLDNLISFGLSDVTWTNWSLHVFYPAVPRGESEGSLIKLLRFNPVWNADSSSGYEGNNHTLVDADDALHIRLDKAGLYWNNTLMNVSRFSESNRANIDEVLYRLTNAKTLYVGSVEPPHSSRAKYRFVRVVYNGEYSTTRNGGSDFAEDPIFGGSL